jgi:hypothetical protein
MMLILAMTGEHTLRGPGAEEALTATDNDDLEAVGPGVTHQATWHLSPRLYLFEIEHAF